MDHLKFSCPPQEISATVALQNQEILPRPLRQFHRVISVKLIDVYEHSTFFYSHVGSSLILGLENHEQKIPIPFSHLHKAIPEAVSRQMIYLPLDDRGEYPREIQERGFILSSLGVVSIAGCDSTTGDPTVIVYAD